MKPSQMKKKLKKKIEMHGSFFSFFLRTKKMCPVAVIIKSCIVKAVSALKMLSFIKHLMKLSKKEQKGGKKVH